ncbi:PepSY domain-containing protein [Acidimangrovimonas sediminis]|uniref:PepSY domain-containing protein n=1 Tax=Acidimangrovimonas sediminis TaxID=2056283 RepID=UPI000C8070D6|nr:PepSY domain-containing protein [Acidimangrovimonas sediminis]
MKRIHAAPVLLAAALAMLPAATMAMPKVGDKVGTSAKTVKAALAKAGCQVKSFEAEGGMVEARCIEAGSKALHEVRISPKTGKVVRITKGD